MQRSAWMCWGLLTCAWAPLAQAASIQLVTSEQTCRLELSAANRTGSFSVVAVGGADATCCAGFTGAAFRIEGLTGDWMAEWQAEPDVMVDFGSLFGAGVNMALRTASLAPSVLLYSVTLTYLQDGDSPSLVLRVMAKDPPDSPQFPCPMLIGGDCPCDYPFACAAGGTLYVNGDGDCVTGLAASTWAGVKRLYRE